MPKIIILNVGTEHALGDHASSTHPITRSGWRHAWFADEGDILISPVPVDEDFMHYLGATMGFDAATVTVLSRQRLVTDELLLSEGLLTALREAADSGGPWHLMPCFWTEGVAELAGRLGIAPRTGLAFAAQRGTDFLNRKTHFRQLAAGAGLPLPDGAVVQTPQTLARAIGQQLTRTGTVIVKQDDGAGGLGNLTLTRGEATALPGSCQTRQVGEDLPALAAKVWEDLTDRWSHGLVVESYHAATHQFYLEYLIGEDGVPAFQNSGTIKLRPDTDPAAPELVWTGLDIPAELPPQLSASAHSFALRLATLVAQIGYRGHLNIDAIATETGELVFNEINARWGGGLVAHHLCERLLGARYGDRHALSTLRDVPPAPLHHVLRVLQEHSLHFSRATQEGVLVLACDPLQMNNTECLVIGASRARVAQLEATLREAMG